MVTFVIRIKFEDKYTNYPACAYHDRFKKWNMVKKNNDWKDRLNVVFSTNPDFKYESEEPEEPDTLPAERQQLRIQLDKRHRNGKSVTLITGFVGTEEDLKSLARSLKTACGVGGSCKEGEILIQGDFRTKVLAWLQKEHYRARII